jgi:alkane 1-monooxygenase
MRSGMPDSRLERLGYLLLPMILIALIPMGFLLDAVWLGVLAGALIVPAADAVLGRRSGPVTGPTTMEIRAILLALLAVVLWSLFRVTKLESWILVILAGASSGYILGSVGLPGAHELGHRRFWFDRWLGQALLACIGYGHYQVAHKCHHVRAALPDDPATAHRRESLWQFFPRYLVGIWGDATRASARARGLRRYRPALLMSASVLAAALIGVVFGAKGLVFWLVQAGVGLFLIGSVDYIQHWGLERRRLADGRFERQSAAHTWESPFWLSERMMFNMSRHGFHHLAPGRPSARLERVQAAPQMPLSYGTMVIIAAIPPLFRRLMEPRLGARP